MRGSEFFALQMDLVNQPPGSYARLRSVDDFVLVDARRTFSQGYQLVFPSGSRQRASPCSVDCDGDHIVTVETQRIVATTRGLTWGVVGVVG